MEKGTKQVILVACYSVLVLTLVLIWPVHALELSQKAEAPLCIGKNCVAANKNNALLCATSNESVEEAENTGVLDKIGKTGLGILHGAQESRMDRWLAPIAIAAAGVVWLLLWIWARNLRLRTIVREKINDISRSQAALRESEAEYRELFENASDLIYTHDLNGNYTSINEAGRRILGYSTEEFLALNFKDIVDPGNLAVTQEYFLKKVRNGLPQTGPYELLVHAKDGTPIWVEVTSRIMERDGKPLGVHGTARDITDRKRAEEALRDSQEKYRLVVENANEAIVVSQGGFLKFVNPKALELTGCSEQELKSETFSEFVHPGDRTIVEECHEKATSGESCPTYSFRLIDRLGNVRWVETNAVSISWEGRPATLNFLVDATAKRKLEEELVKVQKLESLGVLAGGIAHDFNNILTAILGNIAVARMQGQLPEKVAKRLAEAEKACLSAQGLTQQLLTFSKGGTPVKKTALVTDLIQESCPFALRGSNVRCEFNIAHDLRAVEIDEGQIGQVVNNLILNAVHAMPQGGAIQVQAENVQVTSANGLPLKQGPYVKIDFRDHGVGIPGSILPRIFDPYFTTKHKGSGLGLATSYSIVKNHDGLITVESEPGVETVFHVYLPASLKECEIPANAEEGVVQGAGRILIMDDEESIRDVATDMLRALGYEVQSVEDGLAAIALYQEARASGSPFDVVILDLTVPGCMGGAEVIKGLLQIDPGTKAVVSSGYSNDPIMANFEKYGFSGVVAKPYTPKELSDALIRVMTNA